MKCVFDLFLVPKVYFSGKNENKKSKEKEKKENGRERIKFNKTHLQNPIFLV